jgi:endonuclease/exonuclease/phosphatase family metal-dependent hydrolase
MSFNARTAHARDGDNAWPHRKALFFQTIRAFNPDLLGTPEVVADQYDALTSELKDYTPVGVARDDGKRQGEWSLILFKKSRFTLEDSGTFWLSETPDVPGSKSWDTALTRICSYAKLRDNLTGREFLYANTHFDHKGHQARLHSAQLIHDKLASLAKGIPVLLTGDFNTTETDPPYRALTADHQFLDSYRETHPEVAPDEASFNGFKGTTKGKRIDFILHTPQLHALSADIVRTHSADNHYPSDHYPVTAVLQFAND